MKRYKQFVGKIAPFFDLSDEESDLDALEMRIRQYMNKAEDDKRLNPEDYEDEEDRPSPFDNYSEIARLQDEIAVLREINSRVNDSLGASQAAANADSLTKAALASVREELREALEWRAKFEGEAEEAALAKLEEMKEELLANANSQVAFMQELVNGVVDDNNALLVKLGASGDKDALERILKGQQEKIFEQTAKVQLLG